MFNLNYIMNFHKNHSYTILYVFSNFNYTKVTFKQTKSSLHLPFILEYSMSYVCFIIVKYYIMHFRTNIWDCLTNRKSLYPNLNSKIIDTKKLQ